jgi:radical SAM protein with 4Fe4S-binding SPASM domain
MVNPVNSMISRPFNMFRALFSFLASSFTGKVTGRWMPPFMGIELTNHCNLNCPECITGSGQMTRPKGFMSLALFDRILTQAGPYLYNINLYFQGESMMHPDFFTFLEKTVDFHTILSTNGQFLSPDKAEKLAVSGLKKLIVSLDGMDQKAYTAYRHNGDFQKVTEGIKNVSGAIKRTGSPLRLEIQLLVNSHNESQIAEAQKFALEVNAKLRLKSMQVLDEGRAGEWLPENEGFRRYKKGNGKYMLKSRLRNRCLRLWMNPVISWDGKVFPCCFDKNGDHVMGDLNTASFKDIWQGEKAQQFRQSILDARSTIEICRNCTTGLSGVKY